MRKLFYSYSVLIISLLGAVNLGLIYGVYYLKNTLNDKQLVKKTLRREVDFLSNQQWLLEAQLMIASNPYHLAPFAKKLGMTKPYVELCFYNQLSDWQSGVACVQP